MRCVFNIKWTFSEWQPTTHVLTIVTPVWRLLNLNPTTLKAKTNYYYSYELLSYTGIQTNDQLQITKDQLPITEYKLPITNYQ